MQAAAGSGRGQRSFHLLAFDIRGRIRRDRMTPMAVAISQGRHQRSTNDETRRRARCPRKRKFTLT